ncbi:MAG: hypothetical protein JO317_05640, partial [Verrucomicrobiae bacterium]|nr:hypothetical protein [Verrucomicrobiae bacterium]
IVTQDDKIQADHALTKKSARAEVPFNPKDIDADSRDALKAAKQYADQNQISYDRTELWLTRPAQEMPPIWTVHLLKGNESRGYIYASSKDGKYAGYRPPVVQAAALESQDPVGQSRVSGSSSSVTVTRPKSSSQNTKSHSSSSRRKSRDSDVEDTFLGIGGDLEEFFTGNRTVDR